MGEALRTFANRHLTTSQYIESIGNVALGDLRQHLVRRDGATPMRTDSPEHSASPEDSDYHVSGELTVVGD